MKNPNPVNLQTSEEVREKGWRAESRDADGHLISCHAPFEADDPGIAEWIVECTRNGETVTFWPADASAPTPKHHVEGGTYADKHGELRRLREVRGLGTRAMAAEIGISPATLNRAENGETVSVEVAAKLGPYIGKCLCCEQPIGSPAPENHLVGPDRATVARHMKDFEEFVARTAPKLH
ncbi:helix-turn-helix domain-containing protein, partial [Neorhizobium sp. T786]|uniref:helix-turn-helix domain-containing protein n=1 Tax=Pseudorhizobium xiangyangii TaxID=2883104 RepID=UPI001CFFDD9F